MVGSMNSPNGAYDGFCTTIGGCFDVLASHVSPAASKTIHTNYMHTLDSILKIYVPHSPYTILILLPWIIVCISIFNENANWPI